MQGKKDTEQGCGRGELLVSVLYDEATPAERADFEAHAALCASCGGELAAFRQMRGQLHEWELGPVPPISVEIRPGLAQRLREAFSLMPGWFRLAGATCCALLLLAVFNTELSVSSSGVSFRTGLLPRQEPVTAGNVQPPAPPPTGALSEAEIRQIVATHCDQAIRTQLERERAELVLQVRQVEQQLATAQTAELRQIATKLTAQRKKIDELQKDLDRQAGYGGADALFSAVVAEPGGQND